MLARAHAFTIDGLHARHVTVEVDVRAGLPAFVIVGQADSSVREARERIRAAIRNSGFSFPAQRITANLAPADMRKAGPGLDLAIACAVLAASEQLDPAALAGVALAGELGLDGRVRSTRGTLAIAQAARSSGLSTLALAGSQAREAALIAGLRVAVVESLSGAVRVLRGGPADRPRRRREEQAPRARTTSCGGDLSEVRGQHGAVRALLIAAAGGHNLLLSGAPGTGKTMLAQRLPGLLPPLSEREAIEVTRLHSLLGAQPAGLIRARPFRAPHHTVTAAGLIGGARQGWVGEVVLAHNGVLFLDELSEFARSALEALRQPLEEGRVAIARAAHSGVYPARFMLIAATNPCACGYAGEGERCRCSDAGLARHRRRLSGPLLDRIDLLVNLYREELGDSRPLTSSQDARELILAARERQAARAITGTTGRLNAHLDAAALARHLKLDENGETLLARARRRAAELARGAACAARRAHDRGPRGLRERQSGRSRRGAGTAHDVDQRAARASGLSDGTRSQRAARERFGRRAPCARCARRSWLLASAGGVLGRYARDPERFFALLELDDDALIAAIGGRRRDSLRAEYGALSAKHGELRTGTETICVHDARFPLNPTCSCGVRALTLEGGAARLGTLTQAPIVALLGASNASDYGKEVARGLARSLAACGITIVSVLHDGIGAAAQVGVLDGGCGALALLADGLEISRRSTRGALHAQVVRRGCAISELRCDERGRRWGALACERIAVALATLTIVVEAEDTSRALAAARLARQHDKPVGAVPGRVTSTLSGGPHQLMREGASVIGCAQDVLELLPATDAGHVRDEGRAQAGSSVAPELRSILEQVGAGSDTPDALVRACGRTLPAVLLALSDLELRGLLRRGRGGRYVRCA